MLIKREFNINVQWLRPAQRISNWLRRHLYNSGKISTGNSFVRDHALEHLLWMLTVHVRNRTFNHNTNTGNTRARRVHVPIARICIEVHPAHIMDLHPWVFKGTAYRRT